MPVGTEVRVTLRNELGESVRIIEVQAGVTQRLRFISIPANGEYVVRLLDGTSPVTWRQIARDGADLPAAQVAASPARTRMDVGITKDFEFTPDKLES